MICEWVGSRYSPGRDTRGEKLSTPLACRSAKHHGVHTRARPCTHLQIGLLELSPSTQLLSASKVAVIQRTDLNMKEGETQVKVVGTPRRAELHVAQAWPIIGSRCHDDRYKLFLRGCPLLRDCPAPATATSRHRESEGARGQVLTDKG